MPIVFHHPDGTLSEVCSDETNDLMTIAVRNNVPGIIGECGGMAMCATCHVYVRAPYLDNLPPASDEEDEMLEETASPRDVRSRLGCQLKVGADRIEVELPERQV
ncbi:MAG: (2Fe-2S)-binding protein [Pseudonocardia sp.]|nr:MAG: (2Fe-2S)-binding protein [Pseudonocardia sp.]